MFKLQGLSAKFLLFVSLLILLIAGTFVGIIVKLDQKSYAIIQETNTTLVTTALQSEWEKKIIEITIHFSDNVIQPMHEFDISKIQDHIKLESEGKDIRYIHIQDEKGIVLVSTKTELMGQMLDDKFSKRAITAEDVIVQKQANIFDVAAPILLGSKKMGMVRMGFSPGRIQEKIFFMTKKVEEDIDKAISATIEKTLLLGLAMIVIAIPICLLFVRGLVSPINMLIQGTKKISMGDLSYRIETETEDEIGELTSSFNKMTEDLQKATVSKEYFENIIQSMGEILVVATPEGTIQTVNQATYDLLGYEEELIGQPLGIIFKEEKKQKLFNGTGLKELIKRGSIKGIERTCLTKDGRKIPVLFSGSVMYDKEGRIHRIICVASNISERKYMEGQMRQSQKMEALGVLAGGVAHDFNTQLATMLGYGDMLRVAIDEGNLARQYVEELMNAGNHAKELIKQLVNFASPSKEKREPLELFEVIEASIKMLRSSLPTTIKIHRNIEAKSGAVMCDATRIRQVIMNLGINASWAIGDKIGKLGVILTEVEVDSDLAGLNEVEPGTYLRLTMSDTGRGMDREEMERIFAPFFTTKGVGEGSGLGLAVVYSIVKSHRGFVTVESEPGKGSTFHVYLPKIED